MAELAWKLAEIVGTLVAEASLQVAVQKILNKEDSEDGTKRFAAVNEVETRLKEGIKKQGRMFFGLNYPELSRCNLTSSVAVEEIHECYLSHCNVQKGRSHNGGLYFVYGRRGMGKSTSALSLLIHKHSRAPRRGIFFGGRTVFPNGNAYFEFLTDYLLTGTNNTRKRLSELNAFTGEGLAQIIWNAVPMHEGDLEDAVKTGTKDIPGLKEFLKSPNQAFKFGGTPVFIFEDVNITLSKPDTRLSKAEQRSTWYSELGHAAVFFDRMMINAFETGALVFVTTKELNMAKFLCLLNEMEKSKPFKEMKDFENLTCQFFAWTEEKRLDFLKLQNSLIDDGGKLDDGEVLQIVHDNLSSNESIRAMMNAFERETTTNRCPHFPPASLTLDSVDSRELQEGGGLCGTFFPPSL